MSKYFDTNERILIKDSITKTLKSSAIKHNIKVNGVTSIGVVIDVSNKFNPASDAIDSKTIKLLSESKTSQINTTGLKRQFKGNTFKAFDKLISSLNELGLKEPIKFNISVGESEAYIELSK